MTIEFDGAASRHAFAGGDLFGDAVKEGWTGMGIGVDKDEPVTRGRRGAGISGSGDLVDGFEDDVGAGGTGDFGRFVG